MEEIVLINRNFFPQITQIIQQRYADDISAKSAKPSAKISGNIFSRR